MRIWRVSGFRPSAPGSTEGVCDDPPIPQGVRKVGGLASQNRSHHIGDGVKAVADGVGGGI